ncbi:MAG: protein-disulfide isomerase, partial [Planctomycetota bacterium]
MSAIDSYAICPCGTGKKIKFCECAGSLDQFESVETLIEGGQIVPALDKLAKIIESQPNAAWALAIRGRLLLDLREYESLASNAERFVRLQPSNPVALTQKAAAKVFHEKKLNEAAEILIEALCECGGAVDSFVLDISAVLAMLMMQSGSYLTARVYAMLGVTAEGYEGEMSLNVMRQLNADPRINLLLKQLPELLPAPKDANWYERYEEANNLIANNQVLLARDKFSALQRTAGDQPAIISGLLHAAVWTGDVEQQSRLLDKLAAHESFDDLSRARYLAMSAMLEPGMQRIAVNTYSINADISSSDEVTMALGARSDVTSLPDSVFKSLGGADGQEDVPPKAGYVLLDRDKPSETQSVPSIEEMPKSLGIVLVYGKQTDREARVAALDIPGSDVNKAKEVLAETLQVDKLEVTEGESLPLMMATMPSIPPLRMEISPSEAEKLQSDFIDAHIVAHISDLQLPILGNKSLTEAKDDSELSVAKLAILELLAHHDSLAKILSDHRSELFGAAGLDAPEFMTITDEQVETIDNLDLYRVDPSGLSIEPAMYLLQRCLQVSVSQIAAKLARCIIEHDGDSEDDVAAKAAAHEVLVTRAESAAQASDRLEAAKQFYDEHNLDQRGLWMQEARMAAASGDPQRFEVALQTLTTRYRDDREVMMFVQSLLMQMGLIGPDGRP